MKPIKTLKGETLLTEEHDIPYTVAPEINEIVDKINEIIDWINEKKDQLL